MNTVGEGQKWSLYGRVQEWCGGVKHCFPAWVCRQSAAPLRWICRCCVQSYQACAPLAFVVLHQLLLEELVLGLDILGMVFATTHKQSPSELCLAVMAGGSLASTSESSFTYGTILHGNRISPVPARSSLKTLHLFIPEHSESTFQRNVRQLHSFSHLRTRVARGLFTCAQF